MESTHSRRFWFRVACLALGHAVLLSGAAHALECGDVVGPGEEVVLDRDLTDCSGAGPVLTVIGPAVLDLQYHWVGCDRSGEGEMTGIALVGRRAELRHAVVSGNCTTGIDVAGDGRHRVDDVLVTGAMTGVHVRSDRNLLTETDSAFTGAWGILVTGSRNKIRGGQASSSEFGYEVDVGGGNQISGTKARRNAVGYVHWTSGRRNLLRGNEATENQRDGFLVRGGESPLLIDNVARDNGEHGFRVTAIDGTARLKGNWAEGNGFAGIHAWTGRNRFLRNTSVGNDVSQTGRSDLEDATGECGANQWRRNDFVTSDLACIE